MTRKKPVPSAATQFVKLELSCPSGLTCAPRIPLLDTGAKCSEVTNIHWMQINLESRSISFWRPEVNNTSIIFMTDGVHEIRTRRSLFRTGDHDWNRLLLRIHSGSSFWLGGPPERGLANAYNLDCMPSHLLPTSDPTPSMMPQRKSRKIESAIFRKQRSFFSNANMESHNGVICSASNP